MMVRKSVRGCGFGFDRNDAMTQMTQKRRWCARVGFSAEGSNLGRRKSRCDVIRSDSLSHDLRLFPITSALRRFDVLLSPIGQVRTLVD